jgi:hypothetical protein
MIPAFVDGTNLPVGGHRCSLSELEERFASNEPRRTLFDNLVQLMKLAKRCGFLHVLLGGSFPTAKATPSDLDITWFCSPGTTKTSVREECIKIMEDTSDTHNFLYIPFDMNTGPDEWPEKMDRWALSFGYDYKTRTDRGVLLVSLDDDDPRIH